ncbi:hypothetical protein E3J61_02460 [Candidatus Dependentiae bacterium]|nr:MAG: hypothetical protein E3J61_02460 [Candidatus Dependentiae bacterium]
MESDPFSRPSLKLPKLIPENLFLNFKLPNYTDLFEPQIVETITTLEDAPSYEELKDLPDDVKSLFPDISTKHKPTWNEVLGVSPTATLEEIGSTYRELVRKTHPDRRRPTSNARAFALVKQAKEEGKGDIEYTVSLRTRRTKKYGGTLISEKEKNIPHATLDDLFTKEQEANLMSAQKLIQKQKTACFLGLGLLATLPVAHIILKNKRIRRLLKKRPTLRSIETHYKKLKSSYLPSIYPSAAFLIATATIVTFFSHNAKLLKLKPAIDSIIPPGETLFDRIFLFSTNDKYITLRELEEARLRTNSVKQYFKSESHSAWEMYHLFLGIFGLPFLGSWSLAMQGDLMHYGPQKPHKRLRWLINECTKNKIDLTRFKQTYQRCYAQIDQKTINDKEMKTFQDLNQAIKATKPYYSYYSRGWLVDLSGDKLKEKIISTQKALELQQSTP